MIVWFRFSFFNVWPRYKNREIVIEKPCDSWSVFHLEVPKMKCNTGTSWNYEGMCCTRNPGSSLFWKTHFPFVSTPPPPPQNRRVRGIIIIKKGIGSFVPQQLQIYRPSSPVLIPFSIRKIQWRVGGLDWKGQNIVPLSQFILVNQSQFDINWHSFPFIYLFFL